MVTLPPDLPPLPPRPCAASKRDFGRVLVVGGSAGMAGAPALSAMAALRSGAGLVELLAPDSVASIAAGFDPCVMTRGLDTGFAGTFAASAIDDIVAQAATASAVAVGPGLGRSDEVITLVRRLWRELPQPAVFDADGLWAVSQPGFGPRAEHEGPRVITPHAGEMLRLAGREPGDAAARDRGTLAGLAAGFAAAAAAVVVLKGAGSLVIGNGRETTNETGNVGMATAGTGDVLTGVIAALLAQGMEPFAAARLAAWVHGAAGDAASADRGVVSMTARDLLDRLSVAFMSLERKRDGRAG